MTMENERNESTRPWPSRGKNGNSRVNMADGTSMFGPAATPAEFLPLVVKTGRSHFISSDQRPEKEWRTSFRWMGRVSGARETRNTVYRSRKRQRRVYERHTVRFYGNTGDANDESREFISIILLGALKETR